MNIFLDSNILYKDPFLLRGKQIILKELSKSDNVKLYINKAVLAEVRRGYVTFIQKTLKEFQTVSNNLNKNIVDSTKHIKNYISFESFETQFDEQIKFLVDQEILVITPYYEDVVEKIVELDMHEKPPFMKVNGKKSTRDAIIWYSYIKYIEKNKIEEDCYFISNNTRDFAKNHSEAKKRDSLMYELHYDLEYNPFKSAHKSLDNFISFYEEHIKEIFTDNDLDIMTSENLDKIEKLFESEDIVSIIEEDILGATEDVVVVHIETLSPPEKDGLYSSGYVADDGYQGESIETFKVQEVSSYGSRIIVEVIFTYLKNVDLFIYNSVRDKGEDRHTYVGSVPILYEVKANLTWSIVNHLCLLQDRNFKLQQVIDIKEPEDILVEIISYEYQIEYPGEFYDDGLDMAH